MHSDHDCEIYNAFRDGDYQLEILKYYRYGWKAGFSVGGIIFTNHNFTQEIYFIKFK